MIELKVEREEKTEECKISCHVDGTGYDLVNESYAAIHAIIDNIKEIDWILYKVLITAMAHNDDWMCKDEESDYYIQERLSQLTDKSVII